MPESSRPDDAARKPLGGRKAVHRHLPLLDEALEPGTGMLRQTPGQKKVEPEALVFFGDLKLFLVIQNLV